MFEAQLAFYLNKYLGSYLYGLDAESLKVSVWRGDVELRNLALKPEALQDLELPVTVRAGLLGKLTIKIPWSKLGREPVVVEFDRLYILAGPRKDENAKDCKSVEEYEQQAARTQYEAKKRRVDAAEAEWLQDLESKAAKDSKGLTTDGKPAGGGGGGFGAASFKSLIDPILGNLQLRLTNLHIRYEDDSSYPGHPLAVGLTFRKISAHSVDDAGRKAFVTQDALQHLRKAANLQKLCMYFDMDEPFLQPPAGKKWSALSVSEWDVLFLPEAHDNAALGGMEGAAEETDDQDGAATLRVAGATVALSDQDTGREGPTYCHQHLILPVSGTLRYTRRAAKFRQTEADAKQEFELRLESVSLRYSRGQYAGTQRLLEMLDAYQTNAPYRALRPRSRPTSGLNARIWWRYAFQAVHQQLHTRQFSWDDLRAAALMRKRYVPLYMRCLQQKKLGGDEVIAAMDRQLQEGSILLYRRMAHARVESEKRRAAGETAKQSRGWGSWLWGGGGGATASRSGLPSGPGEAPDMHGGLSAEEWAKLEEIAIESEVKDAEDNSRDSPTTLKLSFMLRVATMSLRLVDDEGQPLLAAALTTVTTHLRQYPITHVVSIGIGRVGVDSPKGSLLSCGYIHLDSDRQQVHEPSFNAPPPTSGGGGTSLASSLLSAAGPLLSAAAGPLSLVTSALGQGTPSRASGGGSNADGMARLEASAFFLDLSQRPQDGSADAVVRLNIAPSYVTYEPDVINGISGFFKLDEQLELSALQAQAAVRAEQLRRVAELQLRTLSRAEQKPKLLLEVCMHAPKVAIPSRNGRATLIMDLGLFKLRSTPEAVASLPSDEAALYQGFNLQVDSVAAYVFDGSFSWPSAAQQELCVQEERRRAELAAALAPKAQTAGAAVVGPVPATAAHGGAANDAGHWDLSSVVFAEVQRQRRQGSFTRRHGSGKLVPLLVRFGIVVDLQAATAVHPKLPQLRLALRASPLELQLSPFRFHRLMTVVNSVMRAMAGQKTAVAAASSSGDVEVQAAARLTSGGGSSTSLGGHAQRVGAVLDRPPLWLSDAEHQTRCHVLTWEGVTATVAKWHARWLTVWRGRAYVSHDKADGVALECRSFWQNHRILELPPGVVGGVKHVLAIAFARPDAEPLRPQDVAENSDALVLRLKSERDLSDLRRALMRSKNQIAAVAGLLEGYGDDTPMDGTSPRSGEVGVTEDVFGELLKHKEIVEVTGTLPEVSVRLSGRPAADGWWPKAAQDDADSDAEHETSTDDEDLAAPPAPTPSMLAARAKASAAAKGGQLRGGPSTALPQLVEAPEQQEGAEVPAVAGEGTSPFGKVASQPLEGGDVAAAPGGTARGAVAAAAMPEVHLADEVPLLLARFVRAEVVVHYSADRLGVSAAMHSLDVDDLLVGSVQPGATAMLRSNLGTGSMRRTAAPAEAVPTPPGPPPPKQTRSASRSRLLGIVEGLEGSSMPLGSVSRGARRPSASASVIREGSREDAFHDAGGGSEDEEEQEFFDAAEGSLTASLSSLSPAASVEPPGGLPGGTQLSALPLTSHPVALSTTGSEALATPGAVAGGNTVPGKGPLVSINFTMWNTNSSKYEGVDLELALRLSTLYMSFHRPSIAAVMSLGADFGAINSMLSAEQHAAAPTPAADDPAADTASDSEASLVDEAPSLVKSGGNKRTIMRLLLEMQTLQVQLDYEGDAVPNPGSAAGASTPPTAGSRGRHLFSHAEWGLAPLAHASMDNLRFALDLHPSTMELSTSLGNFVATYGALEESNPHRTICSLRPGTQGSLIELAFRMHSAEDAANEPRAPAGAPYHSLSAALSEVQIVVMQRFVAEMLSYVSVMLAMQPPPHSPAVIAGTVPSEPQPLRSAVPRLSIGGATSAMAGTATPAPHHSQPVALLLDVKLAAPVITLPETSSSGSCVEIDLGVLQLSNTVAWQPVEGRRGGRVLLDEMNARLLQASVAVSDPAHTPAWTRAPMHRTAASVTLCLDPHPCAPQDPQPPLRQGGDVCAGDWCKELQAPVTWETPVALTEVSAVVVTDGHRGANLIHDIGDGFLVELTRPVAAEPTSSVMPPVQVAVSISQLTAHIVDKEYKSLLSVLTKNFAEKPQLHPLAASTAQRFEAKRHAHMTMGSSFRPSASTMYTGGGATSGGTTLSRQPPGTSLPSAPAGTPTASAVGAAQSLVNATSHAATPPERDFGLPLRAVLAALSDSCSIKATVSIQQASLQLLMEQPHGMPPQPLTSVGLADLWLSFHGTHAGSTFITLNLPSLSLEDLRPGVPPEQVLVLSTADVANVASGTWNPSGAGGTSSGGAPAVQLAAAARGTPNPPKGKQGTSQLWPQPANELQPSLLTLHLRQIKGAGTGRRPHGRELDAGKAVAVVQPVQAVRLRLQRPTLVVDVEFIMKVLNFVAPMPMLQGPVPQAYISHQIHLGPEPYLATGDVWLSPEIRILADSPGVKHFIYDGRGHRVVLPKGIPPTAWLPLIIIGSGQTLQLKNVRLVNSASLAACLSIAAGARMIARPEDHVKLVPVSKLEDEYTKYLTDTGGASAASSATGPSVSPSAAARGTTLTASQIDTVAAAAAADLTPVDAPLPLLIDIQLDALGAALHLVDSSSAPHMVGASSPAAAAAVAAAAVASTAVTEAEGSANVRFAQTGRSFSGGRGGDLERVLGEVAGGAASAAVAGRVLRRLALLLDVTATYRQQSSTQAADANIRGLTIRTLTTLLGPDPSALTAATAALERSLPSSVSRSLPSFPSAASAHNMAARISPLAAGSGPPAAPSVAASTATPGAHVTVVSTVLEPCDVAVRYRQDEARQDVSLDISDVALRLSSDVVRLLLQLQQIIVTPLVTPPASAPLLRCDTFERLWCSHGDGAESLAFATTGQGGVDAMAPERGTTVWRPQVQHGYVILGDVLSAGHAQPTHQVATVAVNSGFVAYPTSYEKVWSQDGVAFWQPIPPAGYTALGCVATCSPPDDAFLPPQPPPLCLVGCVHQRAIVETRLGDCMLLCANGNLWSVQNSASTFWVSPPEVHLPQVRLHDLRSPLGIPPAALAHLDGYASSGEASPDTASTAGSIKAPGLSPAAQEMRRRESELAAAAASNARARSSNTPGTSGGWSVPYSLIAQQKFLDLRQASVHAVASQRSMATAVEFQRLWWDKHESHKSLNRVSFWRPVPPAGYVSLGDCMVTGIYAPPAGAMVLRDTEAVLPDGRLGLLSRPIGYVQVWFDEYRARAGDLRYLSIWRPVAPAGYVPVGLVVNQGPMPPVTSVVRCVRSDMVFSITLNRNAPTWAHPAHRQRVAVNGWITDDRAATFTVMPLDDPSTGWAQKQQQPHQFSQGGGGGSNLNSAGNQAGSGGAGGRTSLPSAAPGKLAGGSSGSFGVSNTFEAWRVKLSDDGEDSSPGNGEGGLAGAATPLQRDLNVDVKVGRTTLVLRDGQRTPYLEVGAHDIKMGMCTQGAGVTRCFIFLTTSAWSYHPLLRAWEPVIEPWQVLMHLDMNSHNRTKGGVTPGTWLRLTSTQGCVQMTAAAGAVNSILDAVKEATMPSTEQGEIAARRMLAAAEGSTIQSLLQNMLGVPIQMLLDFGDHQEVVHLPPGESKSVMQPQMQPPAGHASSQQPSKARATGAPQQPHRHQSLRLFLDVLSATKLSAAVAAGELSVTVRMLGPVAELMTEMTWGLATRAVNLASSTAVAISASPGVEGSSTLGSQAAVAATAPAGTANVPAGDEARWHERFVVKLPPALSELLLSPAPGDNPFEGVPLQLEVQLHSGEREAALGAVLGTATVPLEFSWLMRQLDLVRAQAATANASTGGAIVGAPTAAVSAGAAPPDGSTVATPPSEVAVALAGAQPANVTMIKAPAASAAIDRPGQTVEVQLHPPLPAQGRAAATMTAATAAADAPVCTLQLHLSLDCSAMDWSWHEHVLRKRGAAAARALGRRALRLPGSDSWAPFNAGFMQSGAATKQGAESVIPIPAGDGVALESCIAPGGGRYEILRTLCQVYNNTDLVLEVAVLLQPGDDASWTLLPVAAGSANQHTSDLVEEEVFEHQRYVPLFGWTHNNLLPTERKRYSRQRNGSNSSASFPTISLPPTWEWEGPWEVERGGNVDKHGWAYGFDWPMISYPPAPISRMSGPTDFVRKRRWVRRVRRSASSTIGNREIDQANRSVLGLVAPGGHLALPYGWNAAGAELQLRPVVEDPEALEQQVAEDASLSPASSMQTAGGAGGSQHSLSRASLRAQVAALCKEAAAMGNEAAGAEGAPAGAIITHGWSGVPGAGGGVALAHLQAGHPRLLCCRPIHEQLAGADTSGIPGEPQPLPPSSHVAPSSATLLGAVLQPLWMSCTTEGDPLLVAAGASDCVTDWRIVARPPLVIENLLPVAGHFIVWERTRVGSPLKARQQGRVEAGQVAHVYTADMRQQVCLSFWPDGCEYAETEPVIISEGFFRSNAGVSGVPRLPDSFCCSYSHSSSNSNLRVCLRRDVDDLGAAITGAVDPADYRRQPAEAVAQGYPLTVRLFVPLWVINATQLPLTISIIPVDVRAHDDPQPAGTDGQRNTDNALASRSGQTTLRVIDTDAFTNAPKPNTHVTILPNSCELMHYSMEDTEVAHAFVMSAVGSRFTSPILLPGPAAMRSGNFALGGEPFIVRARSRTDGTLHEMTVRLEAAPAAGGASASATVAGATGAAGGAGGAAALAVARRAFVLRIDTHIVVSNRTGYNVHLIQPESMLQFGAAAGLDRRPSSSVACSSSGSAAAAAVAATALPQPSAAMLNAGAVGLPLQWHRGCTKRLLCLSLPNSVAGMESASGQSQSLMWSEPFQVNLDSGTNNMQIVVPVYCLGEASITQGAYNDPSAPAAGTSGSSPAGLGPSPSHIKRAEDLETSYARAVAAARRLLVVTGGKGGGPAHDDEVMPDCLGPSFIRVAKPTEIGTLEFLAVVVNLSVSLRSAGCGHLVLHSIGGEPQLLLHNTSPYAVKHRENVSRAMWCTLGPFSSDGFVRQHVLDERSIEVELRNDAPEASGSEVVTFDIAGCTARGSAGQAQRDTTSHPGTSAVLRLGPERADCQAQVVEAMEVVMGFAGVNNVPGYRGASLGASRLDKVLRIMPRASGLGGGIRRGDPTQSLSVAELAAGAGGSFHVCIEVSSLELSVVDHTPSEVLLLTVDGLGLEYHTGTTAGVSYVQFFVRVRNAQVDDMTPNSSHPVLLLPLDAANRIDHPSTEPLLHVSYVAEPGRRRGVLYCPCIAARLLPLRISVDEPLIWRMLALVNTLHLGKRGQPASGEASDGLGPHKGQAGPGDARQRMPHSRHPASQQPQAASHQQVSVDMPLQIDLLNVEDVVLRLSFKTDPTTRPRFANALVSAGLEFANLEDFGLTLPGLEMERTNILQSMLLQMAQAQLQERLLGIALSVLGNQGVIGSASKILAVASAGMAQFVDGSGANTRAREVDGVGDGMLEGARALGGGFLSGAVGLVAKPIQGADRSGFAGFFKGVGKGLAGAALKPMSGMLAAASKFTEGIDASYSRVRETLGTTARHAGRKRLPRAITGDRVLRSFELHPALGQALLSHASYNSVTAAVLSGLPAQRLNRPDFSGNAYEEHWVLLGDQVLLATNRRVLLLQAPEFVALQQAVMMGQVSHVTDVPAAQVVWQLPWEGLLTVDPAWHSQTPGLPPDGVLVHRKQRGEDDALLYDVRCRPQTTQAKEVQEALQALKYKYYVKPRQEAQRWKDQMLVPSQAGVGEDRPDTMLSLDFRRVWTSASRVGGGASVAQSPALATAFSLSTSASSGRVVDQLPSGSSSGGTQSGLMAFWRPVGPAGYAALGDVAVRGSEPAPRPVRMYKDILNSDGDAPGEGPRLAQPVGYQLMFRDSARPALTIWKPVAPKGYVEVGCVAWPEVEEPPLSLVSCIRRDLVGPSRTLDPPIWAGVSSDNQYWKCGVWQVDNASSTFLATKSPEQRPNPQLARAPVY